MSVEDLLAAARAKLRRVEPAEAEEDEGVLGAAYSPQAPGFSSQ